MKLLDRITFNPSTMGGKPCVRGMRVTVGTLMSLVAVGHSKEEILEYTPTLSEKTLTRRFHTQLGALKR